MSCFDQESSFHIDKLLQRKTEIVKVRKKYTRIILLWEIRNLTQYWNLVLKRLLTRLLIKGSLEGFLGGILTVLMLTSCAVVDISERSLLKALKSCHCLVWTFLVIQYKKYVKIKRTFLWIFWPKETVSWKCCSRPKVS